MATEKPLTKEIAVFVKFHLADKHAFAPFTGQDFSAWAAFLYACQLYGRSDATGQRCALDAMRACIEAAQDKSSVLMVFKKSIPGVLDWGFEYEIWRQIAPFSSPDDSASEVLEVFTGRQVEHTKVRVLWPCPDGERICAHLHSKPLKRKSPYAFVGEVTDNEWLVCSDCKAEWKPAKPENLPEGWDPL